MSGRETFETTPTDDAQVVPGVRIGTLVALAEPDVTALVIDPARTSPGALRARSIVDLHAGHIGRQVLLAFDGGNADYPVVVGLLRGQEGWPLEHLPGYVQLDADGERLVVTAKEQLILRCGKASITLTRAGKVLIEGTSVTSRSAGVNRIKGGSVQLN